MKTTENNEQQPENNEQQTTYNLIDLIKQIILDKNSNSKFSLMLKEDSKDCNVPPYSFNIIHPYPDIKITFTFLPICDTQLQIVFNNEDQDQNAFETLQDLETLQDFNQAKMQEKSLLSEQLASLGFEVTFGSHKELLLASINKRIEECPTENQNLKLIKDHVTNKVFNYYQVKNRDTELSRKNNQALLNKILENTPDNASDKYPLKKLNALCINICTARQKENEKEYSYYVFNDSIAPDLSEVIKDMAEIGALEYAKPED